MRRFLPFLLITLTGFALTGCGVGLNLGQSPSYEYEVVDTGQIAVENIKATPKQFVLEGTPNNQAWERGRLFLDKYINGSNLSVVSRGSDSVERLESKTSTNSNYKYRIERIRAGEMYKYSVNCSPLSANADAASADLNARNVARFLKDGTLEVGQLVY